MPAAPARGAARALAGKETIDEVSQRAAPNCFADYATSRMGRLRRTGTSCVKCCRNPECQEDWMKGMGAKRGSARRRPAVTLEAKL
jgi:hypothetical protein